MRQLAMTISIVRLLCGTGELLARRIKNVYPFLDYINTTCKQSQYLCPTNLVILPNSLKISKPGLK
jgi:hypothetical protein